MLPSLFPGIDWFNECIDNKELTLYGGKFNPKQHRSVYQYCIAGPNSVLPLNIPINRRETHSMVKEIRISYDHKWVREHLNAWQTSYGKSPFYEFYDYKIIAVLEKKPIFLIDLNIELIELLFDFFELEKKNFSISDEPISIPETSSVIQPYSQVFDDRFGFREPMSSIDLLFNLGPMCNDYFKGEIK